MKNHSTRTTAFPGNSKGAPSRLSDLARDKQGYAAAWRRNFSFAALAIEVVVIVTVVGARLH
jgi:hypothetical protein